jgi:hypothetical protein
VKECSRDSIIEPLIVNLRDIDTDTNSNTITVKRLTKTQTHSTVFNILHG